MSFALTKHEPPFYLLAQPLAHSSQSAANFTHPLIEYHFADDPPSNLLPGSDAESVIIIDYENPEPIPVAQSLHQDLAVAGVKVTTAPGATTARDDEPKRNDKMYIIQTLSAAAGESGADDSMYELESPQLILAQFRERNAILRRVLDQPTIKSDSRPSDAESPSLEVP